MSRFSPSSGRARPSLPTGSGPLLLLLLLVLTSTCTPPSPTTANPQGHDEAARVSEQRQPAQAEEWRRPSYRASEALLANAKSLLEAKGEALQLGHCGSFDLLTTGSDTALLEACHRLGSGIDAIYRARFGVRPIGENRETILLFPNTASFRSFATIEGRLAPGYAGYADPSRGYLALPTDRERGELLRTLAHEMTHLVHRRAFARDLPPWLSEGLADALGDTATDEGFSSLSGLVGIEGPAQRMRSAYRAALAPSLNDLLVRDRGTFDRSVPSFDYEASALWVRFFLLDPELGGPFRDWLETWVDRDGPEPPALTSALGYSEEDLDSRFRLWLAGNS